MMSDDPTLVNSDGGAERIHEKGNFPPDHPALLALVSLLAKRAVETAQREAEAPLAEQNQDPHEKSAEP